MIPVYSCQDCAGQKDYTGINEEKSAVVSDHNTQFGYVKVYGSCHQADCQQPAERTL